MMPPHGFFHVIHALDLPTEQFHLQPASCNTFSKCVRKGNDIELSGTEAFAGLILPLVKSLQHFQNAEKPVETALYFDAHLTLAVGILDAPMIAASTKSGKSTLTLVPWVRVFRHEYFENADKTERNQKWAIDIVHKDFFHEYLDNHLVPFAKTFSERTLKHANEIATGKAFASGMGANSFGPIEKRIGPRPLVRKISRVAIIIRNILNLFTQWSHTKPRRPG